MAAQKEITDYAEIQQMEIDALKSIFMEDFEEEETKTAAWNKRADRRFRLRLGPLSGSNGDSELYASLAVALPTTYPKQIPVCQVEFGASVSKKKRSAIKKLVPEKAKSLVGSEAIYEIAVLVQEQLDEDLTALAHTESLPALDEERVKRQAEVALEAEIARNAELKAQQQAHRRHEDARSVAFELEAQRSGPRNTAMFNARVPTDSYPPEGPGVVVFDTEMRVRAPSNIIIAFRTVRKCFPLADGPVSQIHTAIPADQHLSESPGLVLKTCEVGQGWDENELKSELSNTLEADLQALMKLSGHRNVLPVLGFQIQATPLLTINRTWNVSVLNEFVKGGSLRDQLGKLEADTFRSLANQILEGMEYLHTNQIPHGRLTLENILLEKSPTDGLIVKITDMLYQADLHFLKKPTESTFTVATSTYWRPPEHSHSTSLRPTNPADMWQFGILILQMLFGIDIQSRHSGPLKIKDDLPLNNQLENLIERIFKADPDRRPSCFDLRAHAFLREDLPALDSYDSPVLSRVPSEAAMSFTPKVLRGRLGSHGQSQGMKEKDGSRYAHDFAEIVRLGKGGFGQVFRARNKLDGQTYAVKKVISESNETLQSVLSEVMLLSRLYHPNIVRYVTAWIERTKVDRISADDSSDEESDVEYSLGGKGSSMLSRSKQPRSRGLDFVSSKGGIQTDDEDTDSGTDSGFDEDSYEENSEDGNNIVFGEDTDDGKNLSADSGVDDVVFGEDTDDGHEASHGSCVPGTSQLISKPTGHVRRRSSNVDDTPMKITLYIQMEFCENQTLRDIIKSDISTNSDEYWRFLRQIAGALSYVHSNGIIHRDLKPENIFVSGSNIRLGDFGLAKPQVKQRQRGRSAKNIGALTASIGTSVYIAPEVRSSGGGTYDEKADMYSLGVIFFEMCYSPRATIMERAATMNDLRQEPPVFPADFESSDKILARELIRRLLQHKPTARPSAAEVMVELPSEADNEALNQQILAAAANENDPYHGKVIKQFFDRSFDSRGPKHYTYDAPQIDSYTKADQAHFLSTVEDQLIHVFRRHCAVKSTRQQLVPDNDLWTEAVRVLDESGQVLQLPYDLTLPGARILAKNGQVAPIKAYSIGPVFRRSTSAGQHPITSVEIDFDIISKDSLDPALREAEVVKVMDEIIDAVPALSTGSMCFHINHCDLLDAILRYCKIPSSKMRQVKDVISRLGHKAFTQVRGELRAPEIGIVSTSLDDLARFDWRESPEAAITRLKELIGRTESLEPTFSHIRALINFLKKMQVKRRVYISPLSCHSAHFYTGSVMFQCLFDGRKRKTVLCAGGRYDRLVREHASNRSIPPCFAVGFQLSWGSLVYALQKHRSNATKSKHDNAAASRRGEVLVSSNDDEILRNEGIAVLEELWENDIRAELAIDAEDAKALAYRNAESSHDWIVQVKQEGILRVRSMIYNDEEEIARPELLSYLRSKIRERDHDRNRIERPRLHQAISDAANDGSQISKVHVLWAQTRSKKSNRQVIVSDAQRYANELTQKHQEGPIVAVELKDESFEMMRGIRIDDAEGWRKVIQQADLNARQYMGQVHELLVDVASDAQGGAKSAFLYNFRTKACMLYDLTR